MTYAKRVQSKTLIASALAATMAFGVLPTAAQAAHGDITKGVLLGLVTGYAVNQYVLHRPRTNNATVTSYPSTTRPAYATQSYAATEPTPTYYQPVHHYYTPASPESRAFNSEERKVRIAIQYNLMQTGYYNGALDGIWGPGTEGALYQYARANNQVAMLTTEGQTRQLFSHILQ